MNRDAWIRNVPKRGGREHSWKQHARTGTLLREVLGILDKWATRFAPNEGGRRFLVAHLSTILKHCNKGERSENKHFSLDRLKHVLAELRDQHILSKYFESNDGRLGFVMAPHDSLCHVRNGVCILPDRSEVFKPTAEPQHWSARAIAALSQHSTQHRDSTQLSTVTALNLAPPLVIGSTERSTERSTAQPVQLYDFADLTDDVIAKWFADGMQAGGPIPCIRLSPVSSDPLNPSIPADFSQEALEHHAELFREEFESYAEKQRQKQEQPQKQELERASVSCLEAKPTTAEATPKAKQPRRKRDVLTTDEYDHAKTERLNRELFNTDALPKCPHCGRNHLGDGCLQLPPPKLKR